jgi:hypothetical protein
VEVSAATVVSFPDAKLGDRNRRTSEIRVREETTGIPGSCDAGDLAARWDFPESGLGGDSEDIRCLRPEVYESREPGHRLQYVSPYRHIQSIAR